MPTYRLFPLNDRGEIEPGQDFDVADNTAAMRATAERLPVGALGEVWCGTRSVGRVTRNASGRYLRVFRDGTALDEGTAP